ncbi:hypothetical protein SAMN05216302_100559 [Nitrosomonas aestuarii]|uniref:Uncharacterized protein n=1 Tax=Nitrosomonas aestuarii TaxID=52441 RepID=A0A1I3Z2X7_9PROT|nr:hypothetical protein [Nitrosomonas aestuarii]SFK38404.1 hypothetical protein SAMN05216302_100559 [Nitrosomonas aestuarii]
MNKPDQEQLDFILNSAILAPSADNQHRIRFQIDGNIIRVCNTENELPQEKGYKRVLTLMSLGALLENLTIAASRFGIGTETLLFPDPVQPHIIAEIRLHSDLAKIDPLWEAIPLRHTNRRLRFSGPGMTSTERNELDEVCRTDSTTYKPIWFDHSPERKRVLRLMRIAETERFRNRLLHSELFAAVRFDVGWHNTCTEGLPPGALEVEAPMRFLFSALRHWSVMKLANLFGSHHMLGFRACYLPCSLAPHLGLLAAESIDNQSVLNAGRAFQRLWLAVTSQNRVLQPMPASALYALDGACKEGISGPLKNELAENWRTILNNGMTPLMLFRIGKAQPSLITTGRHELNHYLDKNNG